MRLTPHSCALFVLVKKLNGEVLRFLFKYREQYQKALLLTRVFGVLRYRLWRAGESSPGLLPL